MEYLNVLAAAAGAFAFGAVWYIAMSKPWIAASEVPVDTSGKPAGGGPMPFILGLVPLIVVAALMRHIWRPARFRALLDRFGGTAPVPPTRTALLAGTAASTAPLIGLRSEAEIATRLAALREDAAHPPIAAEEVALLDDILRLEAACPDALTHLQNLSGALPAIVPAVSRLARRLDALDSEGVDVSDLWFEASHGRTALEYYDGFVFSFLSADPALPPVASGGRYDALTRQLGAGREIPAVGGIIRPGLVADLGGLG